MKSRNDKLYLYDILECCRKVEKYISGVSEIDFQNNELLQDALVRNIEIIGEAVKNLTQETKQSNPEVKWSQISRMRDKIAHHYFRINMDVVWRTANEDLPILRKQISSIYEKLSD